MATNKSSGKSGKDTLKESDIQKNPDHRIDQDFPGFPHPPAAKKNIKPETENEKLTSGTKRRRKAGGKAGQ